MNREARRYRTTAIVVSLVVGGWIALSACSDQKEGERCQIFNNDDDCSSGLICVRKEELREPYNSSDRCCPPNRGAASTPACQTGGGTDTDSAPPLETGPPPAPDAGSDADADAADAPDSADAAEEG